MVADSEIIVKVVSSAPECKLGTPELFKVEAQQASTPGRSSESENQTVHASSVE